MVRVGEAQTVMLSQELLTKLVLVLAVRLVAGLHTTIAPLIIMVLVAVGQAAHEVRGANSKSQAEKKVAMEIASVLAVRTAAVEGDLEPLLAAVTAHPEVYALSGVLAQTVRHDPFRTHIAPRNLR